MIYIAAPFFTKKQVDFVESIEQALATCGEEYYSPRSDGVLMKQTEEERQANKKKIYDKNVAKICESDFMVAVIDDRDIGTIWEMGYAKAMNIPTVTISNESYGLNVMLAESVQAHVLHLDDMIRAIDDPSYKGELLTGVY